MQVVPSTCGERYSASYVSADMPRSVDCVDMPPFIMTLLKFNSFGGWRPYAFALVMSSYERANGTRLSTRSASCYQSSSCEKSPWYRRRRPLTP